MLKYALLALIAQSPRYGYELKTAYDQTLGRVSPPMNIGQIYSTLQRMEKSGWVRSERIEGDGHDRTIYAIQPEGWAALNAWLSEPADPGGREDFFVKIMAHQVAGCGDLKAMIGAQRRTYMHWLGDLTKAHARLPDPEPTDHNSQFVHILLSHAIRHAQADLEWLDEVEQSLA